MRKNDFYTKMGTKLGVFLLIVSTWGICSVGITTTYGQGFEWNGSHQKSVFGEINVPLMTIDDSLDSSLVQGPTSLSRLFLPPWKLSDLPTFCRMESALEKKTKIPIKFRLGTVQYVDWLEGKPNSGIYPWYTP